MGKGEGCRVTGDGGRVRGVHTFGATSLAKVFMNSVSPSSLHRLEVKRLHHEYHVTIT